MEMQTEAENNFFFLFRLKLHKKTALKFRFRVTHDRDSVQLRVVPVYVHPTPEYRCVQFQY